MDLMDIMDKMVWFRAGHLGVEAMLGIGRAERSGYCGVLRRPRRLIRNARTSGSSLKPVAIS